MFVVLAQSANPPAFLVFGPFSTTMEANDFGTELASLTDHFCQTLPLAPIPEAFAHEPGL